MPGFLASRKMTRLVLLILLVVVTTAWPMFAQRIKRKPASEVGAAHIAAQQAMNDPLLREGDIVVTDKGFLRLEGTAADGSNIFLPIANPLLSYRSDFRSNR